MIFADRDKILMAGELVRRIDFVRSESIRLRGKEWTLSSAAQVSLKNVNATRSRWMEDHKANRAKMISDSEYDHMVSLGRHLVEEFHKMNGTAGPDTTVWAQPSFI